MMSEGEESPAVGLGEPLAVFYGYVDSVVHTVEISAPGRFRTRAVGESGIKDSSQFFYDNRAFGEGSCLQIRIDVLLLYINVMVFGKIRFAIVEAVRR